MAKSPKLLSFSPTPHSPSNLSNLTTAGGPKPARPAHQPLRTGRYSFETMWIGISSVSETCVSGSSPSGWQNSISSFASG